MTTSRRAGGKTGVRRPRVKRETLRDLDEKRTSVRGGATVGCAPTMGQICGPTQGCPPPAPNLGKTAACVKI